MVMFVIVCGCDEGGGFVVRLHNIKLVRWLVMNYKDLAS